MFHGNWVSLPRKGAPSSSSRGTTRLSFHVFILMRLFRPNGSLAHVSVPGPACLRNGPCPLQHGGDRTGRRAAGTWMEPEVSGDLSWRSPDPGSFSSTATARGMRRLLSQQAGLETHQIQEGRKERVRGGFRMLVSAGEE